MSIKIYDRYYINAYSMRTNARISISECMTKIWIWNRGSLFAIIIIVEQLIM
jgi:hypothetical protein